MGEISPDWNSSQEGFSHPYQESWRGETDPSEDEIKWPWENTGWSHIKEERISWDRAAAAKYWKGTAVPAPPREPGPEPPTHRVTWADHQENDDNPWEGLQCFNDFRARGDRTPHQRFLSFE